MKWNTMNNFGTKEYYSEDGNWKLYKSYASRFTCWILENKETHEIKYFGTMKEAKEFAKNN